MNIPDNLKYSKEHEWIRIEEGNIAYVGISDHAQSELGELVYIEVDTIGEVVDKDGVFGTAEAVKTTSELFMPVTAKVLEFNPELDESEGDNPGVINEDAYANWIVKVEIQDMAELDSLMDAAGYGELIA
jgi:glycine cleavage system H protein